MLEAELSGLPPQPAVCIENPFWKPAHPPEIQNLHVIYMGLTAQCDFTL